MTALTRKYTLKAGIKARVWHPLRYIEKPLIITESTPPASRSRRHGHDEEKLVSLPSEGESEESEEDVEMTSGGSDEEEDSEAD